ncbi:hypothetical protein Plhal703r1_c57g0162891 [Plasmopara halstedii]
MRPALTWSRTKCAIRLMFYARGVKPCLVAIQIADMLSSRIVVRPSALKPISTSRKPSQMTSCLDKAGAIYSASADDKATVICRLLLNTTDPLASSNNTPDVERLVCLSPPQFVSA